MSKQWWEITDTRQDHSWISDSDPKESRASRTSYLERYPDRYEVKRLIPEDRPRWEVPCPPCNGKGQLREAVQAWDDPDAYVPLCPHCDGSGELNLDQLLHALAYAEVPEGTVAQKIRVCSGCLEVCQLNPDDVGPSSDCCNRPWLGAHLHVPKDWL